MILRYILSLFCILVLSSSLLAYPPVIDSMAQPSTDLTGVWRSQDQGNYYVRQLGNDIIWVGMSPDEGQTWTNAFVGKLSGDTITGNWADVPRGKVQGSGTLTLKVTNDGGKISIQKTGSTGSPFGATTWERGAAQAVSATQQPPAPSEQPLRKFRITFAGVEVFRCHDVDCERNPRDFSDCAKWDMIGSVNGKMTNLMGSACVPGSARWAMDTSTASFAGQTLRPLFNNVRQGLGPFSIDVAVPSDGLFLIEASGRERDSTPDGAPNSYVQLVEDTNAKIRSYITQKYKVNPEVGYFSEISNALKKSGNTVAQVAGQTGETAAQLGAIFGSQTVPGWGQVALAAYSIYKFVGFLANVNPDDGIGIIKEVCSAQNNFCTGERVFKSRFNGNDQDSTGDYDMLIRVSEIR